MRALHNERGVALIMALVVVLILAAITLGMGFMTTAEVDIHRVSRWDAITQYLAQAGVEHQIYLLKNNKDALATGYINYPLLPGETAGLGQLWYITSLACTLNCTGNPASRAWTIWSYGEVWDNVIWVVLQQRAVSVRVTITYYGTGANKNRFVSSVPLARWEEVYP